MATDPLADITSLLSTLNSYFTGQQLSDIENRVFGQQESATAFAQDPAKMNQFITALQQPYALSQVTDPAKAAAFQQYLQSFQGNYNQQLQQQQQQGTPQQVGSLINQYTQPLNAALTSNVWNQVQGQLGQMGMTQAPGVAAYNYAQALAPYYQQNVQQAANLMQQPIQYGLAEQQYGLSAGGLPMNYQFGTAQMGLGEAQNALQYPFNIGSQLAGAFPNYSTAYSPGTT